MRHQFDYPNIVRDVVSLLHVSGRSAGAREINEPMQMDGRSPDSNHATLADQSIAGQLACAQKTRAESMQILDRSPGIWGDKKTSQGLGAVASRAPVPKVVEEKWPRPIVAVAALVMPLAVGIKRASTKPIAGGMAW